MDVPFVDLGAAYRELQEPIHAATRRVLGSGRFVLGEEVELFEKSFADYVGARHCVGVGNGLDALTLALAALGVGPGDEVVVPGATFVATWMAVSRLGATPVPGAVAASTLTLDPEAVEAALSTRTSAIVPVHLYGHPADLGPITSVAAARGIPVVDDAAQAHGARYHGRRIGTGTSATAFSFYPTKNLGAVGDAGAVTTDDDSIALRVRMLRSYGSSEKHRHDCVGWNTRLDPLQAAVLRVKLEALEDWNARRRRVAARYRERLSELTWLRLPDEEPWASHVYHLFVIRARARDGLAQHLAARSVQTGIHYPVAPYRQPAYSDIPEPPWAKPLDDVHDALLSLPIGPHLADVQIERVGDAVSSFDTGARAREVA
jgi:dTDP-3-amino-3,4,6-trideoxy-alpha-D-glucose transaminase